MNPGSARDMSSPLSETYMPCRLAFSTAAVTWSSTHCLSFLSLFWMCMSDADIDSATESTPQSMLWSRSSTEARFQPMTEASRPMEAMRLTAAFSSPPMAGMPASI